MTKRPRILIVEDDPSTAAFLVDLLSQEGYEVTLTGSAVGASALLKRLCPNAIVLDLGLPFRSGVSLLADLKADPRTASVPIIVCTAQPEALLPARRALPAAILTKPIDLNRLLDLLQVAISSGADDPPQAAAQAKVEARSPDLASFAI